MENSLVIYVAIKNQVSKLSQGIRRFYMKESNTVANIAAMKQLQREILLVTRRQCMKESNTLANIAARYCVS